MYECSGYFVKSRKFAESARIGPLRPKMHHMSMTCTRRLTDSKRQRVCGEWSDTTRAYPQRGVHELFEIQAAQRPEAVAVVDEETRLTYGS
jgi:non-ribosomal peptide synthetase component F